MRRISAYLASMGLEIGDIDAVFITHEHSDHCKALKNFTKYSGIKVFANRLTAESIRYLMPEQGVLLIFTGFPLRLFPYHTILAMQWGIVSDAEIETWFG